MLKLLVGFSLLFLCFLKLFDKLLLLRLQLLSLLFQLVNESLFLIYPGLELVFQSVLLVVDELLVLVRADLVLLFDALVSLPVYCFPHRNLILHAPFVLLELLFDRVHRVLLVLIHVVLDLLQPLLLLPTLLFENAFVLRLKHRLFPLLCLLVSNKLPVIICTNFL